MAADPLNASRRIIAPTVLASSGVALTAPLDTNENTLVTVTVPAGAMGTNGWVRIVALWGYTNSGNNKTLKVKFGAQDLLSNTVSTTASYNVERFVFNRNSASSQIITPGAATGGWGSTSTATSILSVNTAAAVDIIFTVTKATGAESVILEAYIVEMFYRS